ncbi:MAG: hypothetical protein IKJ97_08995, partial [Bacteroidaceae bacterium]|nr:hypothetical protein [Bacteroidaceae bacterium]
DALYCLSVWNVVKDHRAFLLGNRGCFPKASAKVELFFEPTNVLREKFQKSREKINYAVFACAIITTFIQINKNSKLFAVTALLNPLSNEMQEINNNKKFVSPLRD